MNFVVKTEIDPIDKNGYTKHETCYVCKWYIETGHFYLQLACTHRFHKRCMEMQLTSHSRCAICGVEASMEALFGLDDNNGNTTAAETTKPEDIKPAAILPSA